MLRIGWGYDIHRLAHGFPLVLAGVDFPTFPKGFNTHSDGDVVAHALVDALCGALADGSLGDYFPEDDPNDQDARSIEFLRRFRPVLHKHQATVVNLDCTIIAAQPKIGPAVSEMKRNIADYLGISEHAVSVKGKTNDHFGPEGQGEAVSAVVVALVDVGV